MKTSKELKDCIERIKENSNGSWDDMLNDLVDEIQQNHSLLFPGMWSAEEVLNGYPSWYDDDMPIEGREKIMYVRDAITAMRQYAAQEVAKEQKKNSFHKAGAKIIEASNISLRKENIKIGEENASLKQRVAKFEAQERGRQRKKDIRDSAILKTSLERLNEIIKLESENESLKQRIEELNRFTKTYEQ